MRALCVSPSLITLDLSPEFTLPLTNFNSGTITLFVNGVASTPSPILPITSPLSLFPTTPIESSDSVWVKLNSSANTKDSIGMVLSSTLTKVENTISGTIHPSDTIQKVFKTITPTQWSGTFDEDGVNKEPTIQPQFTRVRYDGGRSSISIIPITADNPTRIGELFTATVQCRSQVGATATIRLTTNGSSVIQSIICPNSWTTLSKEVLCSAHSILEVELVSGKDFIDFKSFTLASNLRGVVLNDPLENPGLWSSSGSAYPQNYTATSHTPASWREDFFPGDLMKSTIEIGQDAIVIATPSRNVLLLPGNNNMSVNHPDSTIWSGGCLSISSQSVQLSSDSLAYGPGQQINLMASPRAAAFIDFSEDTFTKVSTTSSGWVYPGWVDPSWVES